MPAGTAVRSSGSKSMRDRIHLCEDDRCLTSLRTIIDDIECPALVADTDGNYVVANHAFCELLGAPQNKVIGSRITDWFPPRVAEERRAMRMHVLRTGRAVHVTDLLRGRRFTGTVRPFEGGPYRDCVFALLQARPPRPDEIDAGLYPLECFDLGPLATLTARELEILELIGRGLSQREIADRLGRTVKTVEAHRSSLGKKLKAKKNVHLVQIAIAAGMLDPAESPRPISTSMNGEDDE